jgi:HSP20 family protein
MLPLLRRQTANWPARVVVSNDLLDREFGRMVRNVFGDGTNEDTHTAAYPVNIWEDDDAVFVEAEMPGFTKDQIDITIEQGVLQISAVRDEQSEPKNGSAVLMERRWSRYFRSFALPSAVQDDAVTATCENGVLHLTLPKRPEVKPRRIKVN